MPTFAQKPTQASRTEPAGSDFRPIPRMPSSIQRQLRVGRVDDPFEHEADRVANDVICTSDAGGVARPGVARPQVSVVGSSPATSDVTAPPSVHEVLNSPGQPLDSATRAFMEPRFGYDFSSVRVHTGGAARSSAADLGALAYTVGPHVVLRTASASPRLLAHELAHVVQQASAPMPLVQRGPGDKDKPKFFDPSRGGLTAAEQAKILAVRKSFNLPDTPTASDTSIVGILVTETGQEYPFHSGEFGGYHGGVRPADVKRGPGSSTNRINRTHVETWAANQMRKLGLKKAVLLIELEPCSVCGGYGKGNPAVDTKVSGVSGQLPEDAQLIVVDGQQATYFRQTPTDPQKPTTLRAPSKPPDEEPPAGAGKTGGGRYTGAAIGVAAGIATVGLSWLAGYLKARVDQKIAQKQIDAFLDLVGKKINANPDEALKKMMVAPESTTYAWIYLNSAVITSVGVDQASGDPTLSDSSPIIDLSRKIDYELAPADPSLVSSFPSMTVGAGHVTMVRTIVIDVPLITPPLEDLIRYAKVRGLPLDDLYAYALGRYQRALSSLQTGLETRVKLLETYQTGKDTYEKLLAAYKLAQKRNDAQLQKSLSEHLVSVASTLPRITGQLKPVGESIQKFDQQVKYWERIVDLVKPAAARP